MLSLGTSRPVQLTCIACAPVAAFLLSGKAQIAASKTLDKAGGGGASEGTLTHKPLYLIEKSIHP